MKQAMTCLLQEEGQGLVEYSLALVLVAIAVLVAVSLAGTEIAQLFSEVAEAIAG